MKEAVEKKIAGEDVQAAPEAPKAQIIDLLEALKRSVAQVDTKVTTAPVASNDDTAPPPSAKGGPKKAEPREKPEKADKKKSKAG